MMASSPAERPATMTEVIALLEACRSADDAPPSTSAATRTSQKLVVPGKAGLRKTGDVPLAPPAAPTNRRGLKPTAGLAAPYVAHDAAKGRPLNLIIQAVAVLAVIGFAWMLVVASRRGGGTPPDEAGAGADRAHKADNLATLPGPPDRGGAETTSKVPVTRMVTRTIFDGATADGWMLTNRRPLDARHVRPDGLNPHGTGSYLVVYHEKLGDFVLDFDYKLSKGGNSGVFLRVGDLNDPVNTGIEVELADSTGMDDRDPGSFRGLVEASRNAHKPGEWNHMTITADGPRLSVALNGDVVTTMNVEAWTLPGKRPDDTFHKLKKVVVANLPRTGYLGFQDLKGDCWFRKIVLKTAEPARGEVVPHQGPRADLGAQPALGITSRARGLPGGSRVRANAPGEARSLGERERGLIVLLERSRGNG